MCTSSRLNCYSAGCRPCVSRITLHKVGVKNIFLEGYCYPGSTVLLAMRRQEVALNHEQRIFRHEQKEPISTFNIEATSDDGRSRRSSTTLLDQDES